MNKILTLLVALSFTIILNAQEIVTTVKVPFSIGNTTITEQKFNPGDTITIIGYKKKGSRYHFAFYNKNYAGIIRREDIPFFATEKQLKKLSNALGDDVNMRINVKQQEQIAHKKAERKQAALSGKIRTIVAKNYTLKSLDKNFYLHEGDTVYLLGCDYSAYLPKYALYNHKIAGIFLQQHSKDVFLNKIDFNHMPSIDDADVQAFIEKKQQQLKEEKARFEKHFRTEALSGNYKAELAYSHNLRTKDHISAPYSAGDTVSILGYSKEQYLHTYAITSDKGTGIFSTSQEPQRTFKKNIRTELLPSIDDTAVVKVLNRLQAKEDSLQAIAKEKEKRETDSIKLNIIEILKKMDPITITVDGWEANSVGGISVAITVRNNSLQTIKYISFQGYFTNPVGDRCYNEIGGGTIWKARGIGPIGPRPTNLENIDERYPESEGSYDFDNPTFYSQTAQYFHLSSVSIQYMNGKTLTLKGERLQKHVIYE